MGINFVVLFGNYEKSIISDMTKGREVLLTGRLKKQQREKMT